MTYLVMTVKLILLTVGLLLLLVAFLKISEGKLKEFSKGKYVKIIEKTALSKNSNIYLLKLGEEGAVIVTNDKSTEIIKKLTKEEMDWIEVEKENSCVEINKKCNSVLNKVKLSGLHVLKKVKGDKYE